MDDLYNNVKLLRAEYGENKLLRGVARAHGIGVKEENILQEVNSKRNRKN